MPIKPNEPDCICPCHEGKVAPHDDMVCPECGEWHPYEPDPQPNSRYDVDPLAGARGGTKENYFRR